MADFRDTPTFKRIEVPLREFFSNHGKDNPDLNAIENLLEHLTQILPDEKAEARQAISGIFKNTIDTARSIIISGMENEISHRKGIPSPFISSSLISRETEIREDIEKTMSGIAVGAALLVWGIAKNATQKEMKEMIGKANLRQYRSPEAQVVAVNLAKGIWDMDARRGRQTGKQKVIDEIQEELAKQKMYSSQPKNGEPKAWARRTIWTWLEKDNDVVIPEYVSKPGRKD